MKRTSLELGGKNPNIVFADCDMDKAVATTVRSSFANQGEICLCGSRIIVERSIMDEFVERLAAATGKLVVGDPEDPNTTTGALVSEQHMNKVMSYIDLAREEGATFAAGGGRAVQPAGSRTEKGYFVQPTIIVGLPHSSRCNQEEIFGPVVTVTPFDTEEEAVALANDTRYGLASTIWSENGRRTRRVAEQLETGLTWCNGWLARELTTPFGGVKASGTGREGGAWSLEFFSELKNITLFD